MPEIRRWGKEYVDRRNWGEYNDSLIRRGEVMLDFDLLDEWKRELKKMNRNKEGAPFRYPEAFMRLLSYLHVLFHLPYRQEEGFIRSLSKYVEGLGAPGYSTIWERTNQLDMQLEGVKTDEPISIAIDSSGIKVTNAGDWMRKKKWKVKRGYLKIHLAVDTKSKQALSMQVTEETVSDGSQTEPLVEEAMRKNDVERVYGDGAYDSRANFNLLATNDIDPAIKVRRNASRKEGEGELREEDGGDRAADGLRGMEEGEGVRGQVGRGGSILCHQADLRRVRVSEEVREHGEGDGDQGVPLQPVHADDTARRRIVVEHSR